jgi:hypothetical protein
MARLIWLSTCAELELVHVNQYKAQIAAMADLQFNLFAQNPAQKIVEV